MFRNTELFGQMDPFVVIEINGKKYKTKVLDNAGKNPVWNQTFDIPINSLLDNLKFTCYDEDFIMDSCVGEAIFRAAELAGKNQWFQLDYKNKLAAKILIECKFIPRILKQTTALNRGDSFEEYLELGSPERSSDEGSLERKGGSEIGGSHIKTTPD